MKGFQCGRWRNSLFIFSVVTLMIISLLGKYYQNSSVLSQKLLTTSTGVEVTTIRVTKEVKLSTKEVKSSAKEVKLSTKIPMKSVGDAGDTIEHQMLRSIVEHRAINGTIIVSVLDATYVDMALNLWKTSYKKFNITNYLFVCLGKKATEMMAIHSIACFQYGNDTGVGIQSNFGTILYNHRVMVKPVISLLILLMGFNTLMVDIDIVFLQNPLPYLTCKKCDLIIQNNTFNEWNSGFYLLKANKIGISIQDKTLKWAADSEYAHDQAVMNRVLRTYHTNGKISIEVLDINKFQPGCMYFKHQVASKVNNDGIVLVHNNWVIGLANKVYRFKEMLLWEIDNDGYYSSKDNSYLTYESPMGSTKGQIFEAYMLALNLGVALNRYVILPQYGCLNSNTTRCNFLSIFNYAPHATLTRESVFLDHHKVPDNVKKSVSPVVYFNKTEKDLYGSPDSTYIEVSEKKLKIKKYIAKKLKSTNASSYHVLRLGSLNEV